MAACQVPTMLARVDLLLGLPVDPELEPCPEWATRRVAVTVDLPSGVYEHAAPACLWHALVVTTQRHGHLVPQLATSSP